jgi:hypothetical protein
VNEYRLKATVVKLRATPVPGQSRWFYLPPVASGLPWIVLKKSKVASVLIFDAALKREAIDDSNNSSRATEVAYEFCVRRSGPSYLYTKTAPAAFRNFGTFGKMTFSTLSPE